MSSAGDWNRAGFYCMNSVGSAETCMPFNHRLNRIQPRAATHDADANEERDNNKLLQEEDTGTLEDQEEEDEEEQKQQPRRQQQQQQQRQQFDSTACPNDEGWSYGRNGLWGLCCRPANPKFMGFWSWGEWWIFVFGFLGCLGWSKVQTPWDLINSSKLIRLIFFRPGAGRKKENKNHWREAMGNWSC